MNGNHGHETDSSSYEEFDPLERLNTTQLQQLVHLLDESSVSEIEVNRAQVGMHLVLRKKVIEENAVVPEYQVIPTDEKGQDGVSSAEERKVVPSPLVGIFHTWAKPKGKALVEVGDRIKVGQRVGTIQSLNVLNEVESTISGRVVEIQVQDGQAVEYGQPLLLVNTAEEA
jgi:acetyl-CoA carboxylase biotin carboxyl carrier protein